MKTKLAVLLTAALMTLATVQAQTATNLPPVTNSIAKVVAAVSPTAGQVVQDGANFFAANADLFTNNVIGFEAFGIYSKQTHKAGGGFDVQIPLSNFQPDGANPSAILSQTFVGFGVYDFGNSFYDGTRTSFGIGNNFNIPIIGETYGFVETGVGRNFSTSQTVGTAFVGARYPIPLYKIWPSATNFVWTVGGAYGDITDQSAQVYLAGTSIIMPLEPIQNWFIKLFQKL